jgi:hypothetical protein
VVDNIISDFWDRAIDVEFWDPNVGGDIAGNTITTNPDSWPWAGIYIYSGIPDVSGNVITGNNFSNGIRAEWLEPSAVIMGNAINILDWANNGISIEGGDCAISENEVTGGFDAGIGVGDFHGMVTSNTITSTITSPDWSWGGIAVWGGDCTISENEVAGSFDIGIRVYDFNGTINSNTVILTPDSSWVGIAAEGGEPTISDNYIKGYFSRGIWTEHVGSGGLVSGNDIIGITVGPADLLPVAIQITGGEPTVEFNDIAADTFDQVIRVEEESTATIINHKLIQGNYGVYCVNSQPQIHSNNIEGNAESGVFNETSETHLVDAEDNWWGHETGPYHPFLNPGGKGDRVTYGVDFEPWLPEPVDP